MKLALVLDSFTFKIKDTLQYTAETFETDLDFSKKSQITVDHEPNIVNNDFVICKDGNEVIYTGICQDASTDSKEETFSVKLAQAECLFDREIFVKDESLLATGLEDFVAAAISDNWINSNDPLMDYPNISVVCDSHTPCVASVSTTVNVDNGIYNLKTYLGNVRERYRLFTRFDFTDGELTIHVYTDTASAIDVDITVSDVSAYKETYNVSVLARLFVRWKLPDTKDDDGNEVIGAEVDRTFYLKTDRSITQNKSDPNRADGISKAVYIQADTEDDMISAAINEFGSNSYQHKVEFAILKTSRIYPIENLYVGRPCRFKTKLGIKESKISAMKKAASASVVALTFGTLKVTLIEKVRGKL